MAEIATEKWDRFLNYFSRVGLGRLGECDGAVECGLDGHLLRGGRNRPGDGDAGEGLRDEEAVPRAKLPGLVGVDVAGADGRVEELSEMNHAGLGDQGWAAWAVCGDGAIVSGEIGTVKAAQADGTVAGAGAAYDGEAEPLDGAGNEFAVEAAAYQNREAVSAKTPRTSEQTAVPEGVDGGRRNVVAGGGTGIADVAVTKGDTKTADGHAREAGDDGEGESLLQGVGVSHG
jgi:hypothetical protein